jgi:hypothetical protein
MPTKRPTSHTSASPSSRRRQRRQASGRAITVTPSASGRTEEPDLTERDIEELEASYAEHPERFLMDQWRREDAYTEAVLQERERKAAARRRRATSVHHRRMP